MSETSEEATSEVLRLVALAEFSPSLLRGLPEELHEKIHGLAWELVEALAPTATASRTAGFVVDMANLYDRDIPENSSELIRALNKVCEIVGLDALYIFKGESRK